MCKLPFWMPIYAVSAKEQGKEKEEKEEEEEEEKKEQEEEEMEEEEDDGKLGRGKAMYGKA